MNNKAYLFFQDLILRRALGTAIMIFVVVYVNSQLSYTREFWIMVVAMLVMQTTVGLTARQSLQRFLVIILSVLFSSLFVFYLQDTKLIDVLVLFFFSTACYFSFANRLLRTQVMVPLMIGMIILLAMIIPLTSFDLLKFRIIDAVIGGMVGFFASLCLLPIRADVEFRKEVIPLFNAVADYFSAIMIYLFDRSSEDHVNDKKIQLEETWEIFPDWIYETGFTAMLQQGHRHFLVRLEEIRQILYTLNYLARYHYDKELIEKFREVMQSYEVQINKVLQHIVTVLTSGNLIATAENLSDSFERIEKKFKTLMPYSLEMLEINPNYVYLAHLIFELKQLGEMVLILAKTLR